MRLYELTVILDSSLDESTLQAEIDKIQNRITGSRGKIHKLDRWGNRRMAYEIGNHNQGYYVFFLFECEPGLTMEIEKNMRINETILRFLTVQSPGEVPVAVAPKPADDKADLPEKPESDEEEQFQE